MLIFVILMTTIFAGVLVNLNRRLVDTPTVLVRNTLMREAENVSDFALRNGVRNANSVAFLDYNFTKQDTIVWPFVNYKVGNCTIDSLKYTYFNGKTNYMVKSYITGEMQGIKVNRSAELAFRYPYGDAEKPNILNLDIERLELTFLKIIIGIIKTLLGLNDGFETMMIDSSGNGHNAVIYSNAWMSSILSSGGAFNKYCLAFLGGYNSWWEPYGATHMTVISDSTMARPIKTGNAFSLMCFAKIDKTGHRDYPKKQGTLMWVPSDPYDPAMIEKPAASIWFDNSPAKDKDKEIHFGVTRSDKNLMEIVVKHDGGAWNGTRGDIFKWTFNWLPLFSYYPKLLDHTKHQWNSYGLTYKVEKDGGGVNWGVLKAYINGVKVGTKKGNPLPQYVSADSLAHPYGYGITLGRRDIQTGSPGPNEYRYFMGLMDQVAMNDEAYDEGQMMEWHSTALAPARIMYLRD